MVKRVVYKDGELRQIECHFWGDTWHLEEWNYNLDLMDEYDLDCEDRFEVLDYIKKNYALAYGLPVQVYKNPLGDCTNNGISKGKDRLYLVDVEAKMSNFPFGICDIQECLCVKKMSTGYTYTTPYFEKDFHHMMGGNFVYSSDIRYREATGCIYPIAIHDRVE